MSIWKLGLEPVLVQSGQVFPNQQWFRDYTVSGKKRVFGIMNLEGRRKLAYPPALQTYQFQKVMLK
ncbi:MAG TPA: hypothetical protein DCR17_03105 [Verrucomicrobiales bacterium]|nr:hypothetical protein [Pedosphaera sp.]HAO65661.1 hypothetical protein [Verrucomicrobiales bacterium]HAQ99597.1 hypothetical protein [Verrucomicrobiales bacterium]HAW02296.1 hypothetical protein [Verrucomicrobiales bacterium]HCP38966.1 hypothetical protein [Verrucomicrobiales bacterium]